MPTSSAVRELLDVAAAKIGASVDTVPSISPTSAGCTTRRTNSFSSQPHSREMTRFRRGCASICAGSILTSGASDMGRRYPPGRGSRKNACERCAIRLVSGKLEASMPRSIWTGAISFGLVTVPVKLYSAVNRKTVRFNQLNQKTGSRINQKRVDASTGEEVAYEDLVKGYEIGPDRYVVIEPGELESVEPKKTKTIEIEDFVDLDEIDPIFYDHPYYLAPGPGGAKPYRLLLEAMRETNKVAIAKVVIRQKESLVAIRPMGEGEDEVLGMATMLFADEVVDPRRLDDLPSAEDVETSDRELDIAKQLVESLAGDFEPDRYHDTYREAVLEMIEKKAAGEEIAVQPEVEEAAPVPDLMSALKASLDAVRERTGGEDGDETEPKTTRKRSTTAAAPKSRSKAKAKK
jgi:DNA end-binding protein Ku